MQLMYCKKYSNVVDREREILYCKKYSNAIIVLTVS